MFKNPISSIHDSDSFNFTDTIDIMKSLKGGANIPQEFIGTPVGAPVGAPISVPTGTPKSNNITVIIVALISVLYMVVNSDSTSPDIINIIDNPVFKLSILGSIIYLSKTNPMISLVAIVIFCLTIQSLQQKSAPQIVDVEDDEISQEIDDIISNEIEETVEESPTYYEEDEDNTIKPAEQDLSDLANIYDESSNNMNNINAQMPNVQMPNVQMPDVQMPDVQMPDMSNIQMPDVQMPNMSNIQMPDVQMPNIQMPDVQLPDMPNIETPNFNIPENSLQSNIKNMTTDASNTITNSLSGFTDAYMDNFEQF